MFEASWPSRLSAITEGSNPTLSMRPVSEKRPVGAIEAQADAAAPWPMGEIDALSDPLYTAMKQGVFDTEPPPDQDAP